MVTTTPRVALWGAGMIAGVHAAACQALGWPIVGVASRSPARSAELARQVGAPPLAADELADLAGVDLAIVCTPPADHLGAVTTWSRRGVPTVVSTPLCDTLADADALVALDRPGSAPLLFASNLAVAPAVQGLFARVRGLGEVTTITGRAIRAAPSWGEYTTGGWGGGALLHAGVDQLTLMLLVARLAGLGQAVEASATITASSDRSGSSDGIGDGERGGGSRSPGTAVDEHAEVGVSFAGGLVARSVVSWRDAPHASWDLQLASPGGVLRLDLDPVPRLEHNGELVPTPVPRSTPAAARRLAEIGFLAQLAAFWTDASARRRPVMNMTFGRALLDVTCACYASAGRNGARVALPFGGPRDLTPLQLWHPGAGR